MLECLFFHSYFFKVLTVCVCLQVEQTEKGRIRQNGNDLNTAHFLDMNLRFGGYMQWSIKGFQCLLPMISHVFLFWMQYISSKAVILSFQPILSCGRCFKLKTPYNHLVTCAGFRKVFGKMRCLSKTANIRDKSVCLQFSSVFSLYEVLAVAFRSVKHSAYTSSVHKVKNTYYILVVSGFLSLSICL